MDGRRAQRLCRPIGGESGCDIDGSTFIIRAQSRRRFWLPNRHSLVRASARVAVKKGSMQHFIPRTRWGLIVLVVGSAFFAACTTDSPAADAPTTVPTPTEAASDVWAEQDAITYLADELFQEAREVHLAAIEANPALLNDTSLTPVRLETGAWTALKTSDGSWLVATGQETYRVFEDGGPLTLVASTVPTPTPTAPSNNATSDPPAPTATAEPPIATPTAEPPTPTPTAAPPTPTPTAEPPTPTPTPQDPWEVLGVTLSSLRCEGDKDGLFGVFGQIDRVLVRGNLSNLGSQTVNLVVSRVRVVDRDGRNLLDTNGPGISVPPQVEVFAFQFEMDLRSDGFSDGAVCTVFFTDGQATAQAEEQVRDR